MEYYLKEILYDGNDRMNAMTKPREDIENIFVSEGMHPLNVVSREKERKNANPIKKVFFHIKVMKNLVEAMEPLKSGDCVYIQFPLVEHSVLQSVPIKKISKRGVKIILFIHDLELFRSAINKKISKSKRFRALAESGDILKISDCIVVHNDRMARLLIELGISAEKIVVLGIFDYLMNKETEKYVENKGISDDNAVIVAGNLSTNKAPYLYSLKPRVQFNLYGVYYTGGNRDNISFKGGYDFNVLPYKLEGRYGLVWDGDSSDTCSGIYGEYLKINNPHKTSLYLAMSLPVIIWEKAALADFIVKNGCGFTIRTIEELNNKIEMMSEEEYLKLCKNSGCIGAELRHGHYTRKALEECRNRMGV